MADTWTLVLTKGTYLISAYDATIILEELQAGQTTVTIALDPFGGVDPERRTVIALAHVVLLTRNPDEAEIPAGDELRAWWRRVLK